MHLHMKFTLDWLKDHLETEATADDIAVALTTVGLEIESVEDPAKALRDFVVAYVVSAEKHPNADKLKVCTVDTGSAMLQVKLSAGVLPCTPLLAYGLLKEHLASALLFHSTLPLPLVCF